MTRDINVKIGLGTISIHTEQGLQRIKQFATKHAWLDTAATAGIFTVFLTGVLSIGLFIMSALASIGAEPTVTNNPKNALLIPGVNDFIPLHATIDILIVLLISAAAHELGHALLAFRGNYTVEKWGVILLLGIIPLGAYVKIPPEELEHGPTWTSLRVLAAGITANYLLFAFTIAATIALNIPLLDGYRYYFHILPNVADPGPISFITSIAFWMAFLNINLAVINSLPIHGLDGGHMTRIAYDANFSIIDKNTLTYTVTGVTILLIASLFIIPIIS